MIYSKVGQGNVSHSTIDVMIADESNTIPISGIDIIEGNNKNEYYQ